MLKLVAFSLIFLFLNFQAIGSIDTSKIQTGDIILQPLSCWSCKLIQEQENSDYSHIGIVIKRNKSIFVAEALGSVKLTPYKVFNERTAKGMELKIIRPYNFTSVQKRQLITEINKRLGSPYDKEFLWDNFENGEESFYCSELVYKVLEDILEFRDLQTKKMPFDINPKAWDLYFKNQTPRGKQGLSPEDFNLSSDFFEINYL